MQIRFMCMRVSPPPPPPTLHQILKDHQNFTPFDQLKEQHEQIHFHMMML